MSLLVVFNYKFNATKYNQCKLLMNKVHSAQNLLPLEYFVLVGSKKSEFWVKTNSQQFVLPHMFGPVFHIARYSMHCNVTQAGKINNTFPLEEQIGKVTV